MQPLFHNGVVKRAVGVDLTDLKNVDLFFQRCAQFFGEGEDERGFKMLAAEDEKLEVACFVGFAAGIGTEKIDACTRYFSAMGRTRAAISLVLRILSDILRASFG